MDYCHSQVMLGWLFHLILRTSFLVIAIWLSKNNVKRLVGVYFILELITWLMMRLILLMFRGVCVI